MKMILGLLLLLCPLCAVAQPLPAVREQVLAASVDEPAHFPGELEKWRSFLQANLRYPGTALKQGIQGAVVISFIVCEDGSLCDIRAESGPAALRTEAERVMRLSPKWTPARKNERPVIYRQRQPITFRLLEDEEEQQPKQRQ